MEQQRYAERCFADITAIFTAICSWRKKDLVLLSLRRLADVGVARATSGVARIGLHTKGYKQQKKATLEKKHLRYASNCATDL